VPQRGAALISVNALFERAGKMAALNAFASFAAPWRMRNMPMKTEFFLPLMTYPDQTSEIVISNAVDLASNCGATLHAVVFDVTIAPITDPWASLLVDLDRLVDEAEHTSSLHGKRLANALRHRCAIAGVDLICETLGVNQSNVTDDIASIARCYDLTVLQSASQFKELSRAVLFGSGRPVVLFPDKPLVARIDHVAIAWDGSPAAARALGDAAIFLTSASQVSIIHVLDEKPMEDGPGRRIFDSLEKRGVKAEPYPIHTHGHPIGDALQEKAIELRADLLVMGGYGHSRTLEFILGGATADVLSNPLLPVLMSH
jgi:nucleotide-binding universal stress UspA family protein